MKAGRTKGLVSGVLLALVSVGCSEPQQNEAGQEAMSPHTAIAADARKGRVIFSARCASCHGKSGEGTDQGPPMSHKIYEPDHHSDYSIERAVKFGVRSHHWGFGNMPPIPGLSAEDVQHVIAYIRQEQTNAEIR